MVSFTEDTPVWIKDWVTWTVELLLPDWNISVEMVEKLDDDPEHEDFAEDRIGEVKCSSESLYANLKLLTTIKNNEQGQVEVVHELCHAFVCQMSEAASRLISTKVVKKTAWKGYDAAEEQSVVRLSRVLVKLRTKGKTIDAKT